MSTAKAVHRRLDHRVQVARARQFLGQHIQDDVSLSAVARAAGASMFHLSRLHRTITGETLGRARTRMRIEQAAMALVEQPGRPVSQIALATGFHTPSSLNKAFRAALGVSPTEFRTAPAAERQGRLARLAAIAGPTPEYALTRPAIQTRGDMRVVYLREHGRYAQVSAPLAWAQLERRIAATALATCPRIAATHDDASSVPGHTLRYDAGVIVGATVAPPPGLRVATWRGGAFAVYGYRGDYRFMEHAFQRIFTTWSLAARKRPGAPCLELYPDDLAALAAPPQVAELWIPIG
jgi:AraC family transcriptional regulator